MRSRSRRRISIWATDAVRRRLRCLRAVSNDRHVLAAAIRTGAQLIVTANLKDFPSEALNTFGIEAVHPDTFVEQQMGLREEVIVGVAQRQRAALKNPPLTAADFLDKLAAQGLVVTADRLRAFESLI